MNVALFLFDLALLLLVTMRLTRLVVTDSIGQWWIYEPFAKKAWGSGGRKPWAKYVEGLQCPFCVGFWIGLVALASLYLVGGPGDAAEWWRWATGVFALNWIAAHIGSRLDD